MKVTIFISIQILILLINIYISIRGYQVLEGFPMLRVLYPVLISVLFISMYVAILLDHKIPIAIAKPLNFIAFSYMILMYILFLSFLIVDIYRGIDKLFAIHYTQMYELRLYAFLFTLLFSSTILAIGHYRFLNPSIIKLHLKTNKPPQNKKIRIVAASDIHLGTSIGKELLSKYISIINAQNPDIILLVGDIVDRSLEPVMKQNLDIEIRNLKSKYGTFAVFGNHEYYGQDIPATELFYKSAGINILRDKTTLINNEIQIIGRDDKTNVHRLSLDKILEQTNRNLPTILMDHQPYFLENAERNNIDLQLSGHTHNGQIFPGNLIVNKIYEKGYGYLKKGNTHYYISSGLGIWGPQYRLGTKSEIVVIDFEY